MTTLVIGAHPDDEVLGLGGTIAKLASAGEKVCVLIVTDGSSTQYPGDQEKRRQKDEELRACCRTLGVQEVVHGQLPDMQLDGAKHTELNDFIGDHIATSGAKMVVCKRPLGRDVKLKKRVSPLVPLKVKSSISPLAAMLPE